MKEKTNGNLIALRVILLVYLAQLVVLTGVFGEDITNYSGYYFVASHIFEMILFLHMIYLTFNTNREKRCIFLYSLVVVHFLFAYECFLHIREVDMLFNAKNTLFPYLFFVIVIIGYCFLLTLQSHKNMPKKVLVVVGLVFVILHLLFLVKEVSVVPMKWGVLDKIKAPEGVSYIWETICLLIRYLAIPILLFSTDGKDVVKEDTPQTYQSYQFESYSAAPVTQETNTKDRLKELQDMLSAGLITQEDYDIKKQKILKDM